MFKVVKLGNIIELIMGQAPLGITCNKDGIGIPFVKAGEFSKITPVIKEWTTDPKKFGKKGDVFLCVVGATCGKINFGTDCAIGRSVAALRPNPYAINQKYLYYFMSKQIKKLRKGSLGAAQTVISKEMINNIDIKLPPITEQQRIVDKLDQVFDDIEKMVKSNDEIYSNMIDLKSKYIDKLFTLVDGEKTILEKVTTTLTCGVAKRPKYVEKGIPFLSARNVKMGKIKWENYKFIDKETYLKLTKYSKPEIGDVLYTRVGSFGEAAVVDKDIEFSIFVSLTLIKPCGELLNEYLCFYLNSSFIKKLASESITGTGVGNLNVGAVRNFPIDLISMDEQISLVKKINVFLESWNKLVLINSKKLENLLRLKEVILSNEIES